VLLLAHGRMVYEGSSHGSSMVDWFTQQVPRALRLNSAAAQHGTAQHASPTQPSYGTTPPRPPTNLHLHYDSQSHGTTADWVMDLLTSPSLACEQLVVRGLVSLEGPPVCDGSPAGEGLEESVHAAHEGICEGVRVCGAEEGFVEQRSGCGTEGGGLKAKGGGLKAKGGGLKAKGGGLKAEGGGLKAKGGGLKAKGVAGLFDAKGGGAEHWVDKAADVFEANFVRARQQRDQSHAATEQLGADPCRHDQQQVSSIQSGTKALSAQLHRSNQTLLQHLRVWGRRYKTLVWREGLAVTRNPTDVAGRCAALCNCVYLCLCLYVSVLSCHSSSSLV